MTCSQAQQLISERLDRRLSPPEAAALEAHLAGCAQCAAFARSLRGGLAGIAALPPVTGNSKVRAAVMDELNDSRPRGVRGWAGQGLKLAGAVAVFALVAVVLVAAFS